MIEFRVVWSENRWIVNTYISGSWFELKYFDNQIAMCDYMTDFSVKH